MLGRRREAALGADRDGHRRDAERQQCVAVAGIAGFQHPHAVAGVEQRQERQREARRCPGNHHDPFGVDAGCALGEPAAQ
jgi:hypothetical protein